MELVTQADTLLPVLSRAKRAGSTAASTAIRLPGDPAGVLGLTKDVMPLFPGTGSAVP
jgi:hypothetical protein